MIDFHEDGVTIGGRLSLIGEKDDVEMQAWAERIVTVDPNFRWLVGNFIESERANQNGHIFPLPELRSGVPTLQYKALNMLHMEQYVLGTFAAGQLVKPDGTELKADEEPEEAQFPILESLAAMWVRRFPEEFLAIRGAHAEGALFYSHETVPSEVSCPDCGLRAKFDGLTSDNYCAHMDGITKPKIVHDPVFSGGAVVIPPARPGWNRADMKQISALIAAKPDRAESLYNGIMADLPNLDAKTWEDLMARILLSSSDQ